MADIVRKFREVFAGREDHRLQTKLTGERTAEGKTKTDCKMYPVEADFEKWVGLHIDGKTGLGGVPIHPDGKCRFGVIDDDDYKDAVADERLKKVLNSGMFPMLHPCRSKSGGVQYYLFPDQPVKADLMIARLSEIASFIGCPENIEIFPKQNSLSDGAVGNAINYPYFDAANTPTTRPEKATDSTARFCYDTEMNPIPLETFLNHVIENGRVPAKRFDKSFVPFFDGPPCIQKRLFEGIQEGQRDNTLYQFGIYGKLVDKANGTESIGDTVRRVNDQMADPLDARTVNKILTSIGKPDDKFYKCPEFVDVCDKEACQKRRFGVGGEGVVLGPDDIVLPRNGWRVSDTATDLFSRAAAADYYLNGTALMVLSADKNAMLNVEPRALVSKAEKLGNLKQVVKRNGGAIAEPATMKTEEAQQLLVSDELFECMRDKQLETIVDRPLLDVSGKVLGSGYHPDARVYVTEDAEPDMTMSIEMAKAKLESILYDFQPRTEADKTRALAMLFTIPLRNGRMLPEPCPINLIMANTSQAGKGYFTEIAHLCAHQGIVDCVQQKSSTYTLDDAIASAYIEGAASIRIDNARGALGSAFLESAVTCKQGDRIKTRLAYNPNMTADPTGVAHWITSNQMQTTVDLANRCMDVSLIKRPDDYEFKLYDGVGLKEHLRTCWLDYLSAIYVILKHWIDQGRSRYQGTIEHDMSDTIGVYEWIMREVFKRDDLMTGHKLLKKVITDPDFEWLQAIGEAVIADGATPEKEFSATELRELSEELDLNIPRVQMYPEEMCIRGMGRKLGRIFRDNWFVQISSNLWVSRAIYDINDKRVERATKTIKTYKKYIFWDQLPLEQGPGLFGK